MNEVDLYCFEIISEFGYKVIEMNIKSKVESAFERIQFYSKLNRRLKLELLKNELKNFI